MDQPEMDNTPHFGKADLTSCDREQIHIPGHVQQFGALIALTADRIIQHASQNIDTVLGVSAENAIGKPFEDFASHAFIHDVLGALQMMDRADAVERLYRRQAQDNGGLFHVAVHRSGDAIILEFEAAEAKAPSDLIGYVRPMIERVTNATTIPDLCTMAARQMKALTGFDRVMVYRFDADYNGEVVAEALSPGMEPFLGLHYPASDIPKQARELYTRNLLRLIGDVNDPGVEIIPTLNPHGAPLDLSMSTTRAVSPIHLEYLRNMGVSASMSVSIMKQGKLWGLFACHHRTPHVPSYPVRTASELFAHLFSYLLERKENEAEREAFIDGQALHDKIMVQLATDTSVSANFDMILDATRNVIPFDGAVGWIDGLFQTQGLTPTEEEFKAVLPFLNTAAASRVYATHHLAGIFPTAADYAQRAAGLLALPVSRSPRDYIVFFRREISQTVNWAGNPDKAVTVTGEHGTRLTPRKSFEAWQQEVTGQCAPWTDEQVRAAEALRVTLMEVVLRLADSTLKERARASEQQEVLIAELNHRVRNILNLIKGLINQSASGHSDVTTLTALIGGRIDALARAHDQITRQQWAPASLYELVENESDAYLGSKMDRVAITGPDAMLKPDAFSTLSLVIHELMTNSAKYGALCDSAGTVAIETEQLPNGALKLSWRETGGPPVKEPKRRGFGTTIIERSIPFELQGTSTITYDPDGVKAELTLPTRYVDAFTDRTAPQQEETENMVSDPEKLPLGDVLVVEDNMIIALDAEVFMEKLGAKTVSLASSVRQALTLIDSHTFGFALLDVNLGTETSVPIAEKLAASGIPFAFATGYGETQSLSDDFPDAPTIQKPYDLDILRTALRNRLG